MNEFFKRHFCLHTWHIISSVLSANGIRTVVSKCYWCNKEKTEFIVNGVIKKKLNLYNKEK